DGLLHDKIESEWVAEHSVTVLGLGKQCVAAWRQSNGEGERPYARTGLGGITQERIAARLQLAVAGAVHVEGDLGNGVARVGVGEVRGRQRFAAAGGHRVGAGRE